MKNDTKPQTISGDLHNLPAVLAPLIELPHWVLWQLELVDGKWTKVPYQANGRKAKNNDPKTWTSYELVIEAMANGDGRWDGIGFNHLNSNIAAFDIDHCRDPDSGALDPWAAELIRKCSSYTEITPSGTGLRIFGFGVGGELNKSFKVANGVALEAYRNARRYITITGNPLPEWNIGLVNIDAHLDEAVAELDFEKQLRDDAGKGVTPNEPLREDELERFAAAVEAMSNSDRDWNNWNRLGLAIYRASNGSEKGRSLFHTFSSKSSKYDQRYTDRRWDGYHKCPPTIIGAGSIYHEANKDNPGWGQRFKVKHERIGPGSPDDGGHHARQEGGVELTDFHAYMPQHNYLYTPTREPWPASSVNARIAPVPILDQDGQPILDEKGKPKSIKASTWLDQNRPVEQMTWAPGFPMLIRNRLVSEGGWIERNDVSILNLYRPPMLKLGDASKADPWLEHVHKIFGNEAAHIINWLGQRVQHPDVKINHALVFGSNKQGIGKDAALEPVKRAVGPWNFQEVSPQQIFGRFNGFLQRVILRVNEARDLGEVSRYQFYDHMKSYTAAPPDVLRVDEKHLREHSIFNCVGVILTTNYKTNGIYLPAEDRRHFVAWSDRVPEDFSEGYWTNLWHWYEGGGDGHVAAYLASLDLTSFDPKAPPPKTSAFWDIVEANRAPEDAELADILDRLNNPPVTTLDDVIALAGIGFAAWLGERKNRRQIPYRFEQCGYLPVRNPANKRDGLWTIRGQRQTVYARQDLSLRDQLAAAGELTRASGRKPDDPPF